MDEYFELTDTDFTGAFHDGITQNDLSNGIGSDHAGSGIFDGVDVTDHIGPDIGVLKGQICAFHGAVD